MSFTPSPLPVISSRPDVPLPQSFLGHAEVVALEHIDVEVQERRALHDLVVRIASGAVLRVVTVKIVQTYRDRGKYGTLTSRCDRMVPPSSLPMIGAPSLEMVT